MGFVVKQPSRMQGQCFFFKVGVGRATVSGQVQKISLEGCPNPDMTPPKIRAWVFGVRHTEGALQDYNCLKRVEDYRSRNAT